LSIFSSRPLKEEEGAAEEDNAEPKRTKRDAVKKQKAVIQDPNGMHLRVAAGVAHAAKRYGVDITICKDCKKADGCSVLELLMLDAPKGSEIEVMISGEKECDALQAVLGLFSNGGGI
jgi:phosphotransferase system HPr (HPr) family protein